mgnify:CR=1 FL=1|jgi:hypothetical protein
MNKAEFVNTLYVLNADLRAAIADGDFDEVRRIDGSRQKLLHQLAAKETSEGSDDFLECLEGLSSEIADNLKQVERQFGNYSRSVSGRFKLLDGYRV